MSINSKLNALVAAQAAQTEILGTILTTVQGIPGADTSGIQAAIEKLNKQVTDLNAEIGDEEPNAGEAPAPTEAPAA